MDKQLDELAVKYKASRLSITAMYDNMMKIDGIFRYQVLILIENIFIDIRRHGYKDSDQELMTEAQWTERDILVRDQKVYKVVS